MKLKKISTTRDRLQEAMARAGKRQTDLVRETGLNRGTISRYLSGEVEPKSDAVNKLAASLNCSEMWLWGYDVPMERETPSREDTEISEGERVLLELFRRVPENEQRLVLQMIRAALGSQEQ